MSKNYDVNELGIIEWHERGREADYHNPFNKRLKSLQSGAAPTVAVDAFVNVYEVMINAQAIATSVFGQMWEIHIFKIYDQLVAEQIAERGRNER